MVNQKDQMVKIFFIFLQRLIDTVCCLAQMYKVKFRAWLKSRWDCHFLSFYGQSHAILKVFTRKMATLRDEFGLFKQALNIG